MVVGKRFQKTYVPILRVNLMRVTLQVKCTNACLGSLVLILRGMPPP